MKERPMLFQGAMVRALLAGTKTQTRRVAKFEPREPGLNLGFTGLVANHIAGSQWVLSSRGAGACWNERTHPLFCPYGEPGDRLWVREKARCSYRGETPPEDKGTIGVDYAAGGIKMQPYALDHRDDYPWFPRMSHNLDGSMRWAPGIHMPRWASRILLEVIGVRVERLQDISEEDARAEGARHFPDLPRGPLGHPMAHSCRWSMESPTSTDQCLSTPQMAFANYINKVNGDGTWEANAWVWVVEFKRVTP